MNIRQWLVLGALMGLALTGTAAHASGPDRFREEKGELRIAGGTAHIPVMKEAARRVMTLNPAIQVSIAGGGSGVGIKQVGEGLVDIGNSGRKPTEDEVSRYNLKQVQWAIDGVGVVVNPANPARAMSRDQLRDVYAGTITNWRELGGPDKGINLYTRDEASGTREVFWKKGLGEGEISGKANVVVSNGAMKAAVSQDPHGIGYVSVGHIDAGVAAVALDGVMPSRDTVQAGSYPVARGLYSLTRGEPEGLAKTFLDYLLSEEGQKIAADNGFIPVR